MDETETYIKMSDCPEIQGLRSERIKKKEWWDEGDFSNYPLDGRNVYAGHYVRLKGNIWLPRQDQLQEMVYTEVVQERYRCSKLRWLTIQINLFWEFHESSCDQFTSMEQLWLAFVMKEKYGKIWNGEKWSKN